MKLFNRMRRSYWLARGALAALKGEHERAAIYLDRSVAAGEATHVTRAYRAFNLMLAGRREEARPAFREVLSSTAPAGPRAEYARAYARMVLAYLDDDLVEADRLAAELKNMDGPKALLPPLDSPSLVAANGLLDDMGIGDADPLGFREERSGMHWMQAVKAYSRGQFDESLEHIEQAEAVRAATPAQKALKAGLLTHLDRTEEAQRIFDEVISELAGVAGTDERYILLFCLYHRIADSELSHAKLFAEARQLRPESSLRHFLPLDLPDRGRLEAHFKRLNNAYGDPIIRLRGGRAAGVASDGPATRPV